MQGRITRVMWQAKYPYAAPLAEHARREGYYGRIEALLDSEEAVRLAEARLRAALSKEGLPRLVGRDSWEEALSFYAALGAAAKSGSLRLLRRLADAEAERARIFLSEESQSGLLALARALGLRAEAASLSLDWLKNSRGRLVPRLLQYSVPVSDYLVVASRLPESRWRLVNSFLAKGRVYLDAGGFRDLLAARVRQHVESLSDAYAEYELPSLTGLGKKYASQLDWGVTGEFNPEAIPPCIREIMERVKSRSEATLEEFYMLAAFLANVNAPVEYVEEFLYSAGLVGRSAASVLARALLEAGRKRKPYTCEAALAKGLCGACKGRGPLSEYYAAIRRGPGRRGGSRGGQ